jgi:glutaredoxin
MDVLVAATRGCQHRPILDRELTMWGVDHRVMYFEDHPELTEKFGYQTSPLVIIDGEVASVGMPDLAELQERLGKSGAGHGQL